MVFPVGLFFKPGLLIYIIFFQSDIIYIQNSPFLNSSSSFEKFIIHNFVSINKIRL